MDIQLLVDGRPALTTAQAAARHGLTPAGLRRIIHVHHIEPVAYLDDRTPLYDPDQLAAALAARPGRGRRRVA